MNLEPKKKKLVEEFNKNNQVIAALQGQLDQLRTRQVHIQGQLALIAQLLKEEKENREVEAVEGDEKPQPKPKKKSKK